MTFLFVYVWKLLLDTFEENKEDKKTWNIEQKAVKQSKIPLSVS